MPDSSLFESLNDRTDDPPQLTKGWQDCPIGQERSFIEAYIDGDLKIVIRRRDIGPSYRGIILEARPSGAKFQPLSIGFGVDEDALGDNHELDEPVVFTYNIETMESPKRIIPSIVRLQTFDDRIFRIREPLFTFAHFERIDKIQNVGFEGKVVVSSRSYAVAPRQGSPQHIEGTPQTINYRPDFGIDQPVPNTLVRAEFDQLLSHLWPILGHEVICWSRSPIGDSFLETFELGYGPIASCIGV